MQTVSKSLGVHCALTHDQLWPHKARLLQLVYEHIAAHAPGGAVVDLRTVDAAAVPSQQLQGALVELNREVSEATAASPLGSGAPLLGFNCGLRQVNNLHARYAYITHVKKQKCQRHLSGVSGPTWATAKMYAAANTDIITDSDGDGDGESISIRNFVTIMQVRHHHRRRHHRRLRRHHHRRLHRRRRRRHHRRRHPPPATLHLHHLRRLHLQDMLGRLQGVPEVATSGLLTPLWPAVRRLIQAHNFDVGVAEELRSGARTSAASAAAAASTTSTRTSTNPHLEPPPSPPPPHLLPQVAWTVGRRSTWARRASSSSCTGSCTRRRRRRGRRACASSRRAARHRSTCAAGCTAARWASPSCSPTR